MTKLGRKLVLTLSEVDRAWSDVQDGVSVKEIAKRHKVTTAMIYRRIHEKFPDAKFDYTSGKGIRPQPRDEELVRLRRKGYTYAQIGKHFNCSKQAIHQRLKILGAR